MVWEYQEVAGMSGGSWGGPIRQTGTCGDNGAPGSVKSFVFILIFQYAIIFVTHFSTIL